MTRKMNLSAKVKCAKCGARFERHHGSEKLCLSCKRPSVRTRLALRNARPEPDPLEARLREQYPNTWPNVLAAIRASHPR